MKQTKQGKAWHFGMKLHVGTDTQWTLAGGAYRVNRRGTPTHPLTRQQQAVNRARSRHRARGEHPFHVIKHLRDFVKVRYRGLAKHAPRACTRFALANLYRVRHLLAPRRAALGLT